MQKAIKSTTEAVILFAAGGLLYCLFEIAWRGYTHWTMFILGGALFLLVGGLNETVLTWETPLLLQGVYGSVIATAAELLAGLVLNIYLGLGIWDYSNLPFNLLGQICLPFSLLWVLVSMLAVILDDYMRYWLFGEEKPHYRLFGWS